MVLAIAWEVAWRVLPRGWYMNTSLPFMPTIVVVALMMLTPLRRPITALARVLVEGGSTDRGLFTAAIAAIVALGVLGLGPWRRESTWLPMWLAWVRPLEESPVLLLMPMWGAWAMMAVTHFCPIAPSAIPLAASYAKRQPVAATAVWMAIPLAGTLWELNFLWGFVAIPAAMALISGSVVSVILCRRAGGVRLATLRACNAMTQLAFLGGYLIAKSNTW